MRSKAYAYASSPFTNLCSCAENNRECPVPNTVFDNVQLLRQGETISQVETSTEGFFFCNQDQRGFPPVPSIQWNVSWMTDGQERLTRLYGWTCFTLLIVYCVVVLGNKVISTVLSLVKGVYKVWSCSACSFPFPEHLVLTFPSVSFAQMQPKGGDQHKDFSSGVGIETFGYIPQLVVPGFHFPLLVCDVDGIDVKLIGWKDPNKRDRDDEHRSYDDHNLIFDVPNESVSRSRNKKETRSGQRTVPRIFSVVKHYPPKWYPRSENRTE